MHQLYLQEQIRVLKTLIQNMDELFDEGIKENFTIDKLQAIYNRLKQLKAARNALLKRRQQARKSLVNSPAYRHLLCLVKEGGLN